jgi:hypothetical protein
MIYTIGDLKPHTKTYNSSVSDIVGVSLHAQNSHSISIKHAHVINIKKITNSRISIPITFIIGCIYLNHLSK